MFHQLHGGVVYIHAGERHVWITSGNISGHFPPQLHGFEHIGFVDRAQLFAALARGSEADMHDAANLALGVAHRVKAFALALERPVFGGADAARLAKINIAGQFAQNQNIEASHHFRLQGRGIDQFRKHDRGPQIGKQTQMLAQTQHRLLRAFGARQGVVLPAADRAKQNRVGIFGQFQGGLGQRVTERIVSCAANRRFFQRHRQAEGFEDTHRLNGDFFSDAVSRQHCDVHWTINSVARGSNMEETAAKSGPVQP